MRVIQALYRASTAGVSIDLCVRGICCLRPGVPGVSENIRVFSIVGRFLEHERVFVFGPAGEEEFYLSSADWMPRNLYRRVEILFPVEDKVLRERLRHEVMEPALDPNRQAYRMDSNGVYTHEVVEGNEPKRGAQEQVLDRVVRSGLHALPARRDGKGVRKGPLPSKSLS